MTTGVAPSAASWARVTVVPPMVTLIEPSAAASVMTPPVSPVSATLVNPDSVTVAGR